LRRRSTTEVVGPSSHEVRAPFRVFRSESRALLAQTHPACRSSAPRSSSPTASQHGFESELRLLSWASRPLRSMTQDSPASSSRTRRTGLSIPGQPPMSFRRSSAHAADRVLRDGACHTPPEPTPGVSTPSANRPLGHPHCLSGLFHPDNARELSTFRVFSFQRSVTRLRVRSSHAVARIRASSPPRSTSKVFPSGNRCSRPFVSSRTRLHTLLAFFPSEVFPPPAVETGFPDSSSYALLILERQPRSRWRTRDPGVSPTGGRFRASTPESASAAPTPLRFLHLLTALPEERRPPPEGSDWHTR